MLKDMQPKKRNYAYYVRKYFLVTFVVASFAAYAIHENGVNPDNGSLGVPVQASNITNQPAPPATIYPTPTMATPSATPATNAQLPLIGPPAPVQSQAVSKSPLRATPTDPPPTEVPPTPSPTAVAASGSYKDGQYTGNVADAYYGPLQVKVVIQKGKITNVQFLDYPHDRRRSQEINDTVMPWLHDEAIQAQNAQVDIISGATLTSEAFIESLQSALNNARL